MTSLKLMLAAVVLLTGCAGAFASGELSGGGAVEAAEAAQDGGRTERQFNVGAGKRLTVDLKTGGTVDIAGTDGGTVTVVSSVTGENAADTDLVFNETADGLHVVSRYTGGRRRNRDADVRLEIRVPRRTDIALDTMGGDIRIAGVEGDMRGKTMGGALDLSDLKGVLDMTTMGGSITLKQSQVNGKVSTMGGEVLLEDVTGDVKGSSMGGKVTYKNVTNSKGETTGQEVKITSMGGEISVDEAPAGADVSTMGGDIEIRSAAGFVKAKTMGGDIRLDSVDGGINATTMGGDVNARMVGDPNQGQRDVEITSMGGDIFLTVPAGLSMDIHIEVSRTRNSARAPQIVSDFPVQQRESADWITGEGTPRKIIYGTGQVGGGRNRVVIKTVNGDVHLKRG